MFGALLSSLCKHMRIRSKPLWTVKLETTIMAGERRGSQSNRPRCHAWSLEVPGFSSILTILAWPYLIWEMRSVWKHIHWGHLTLCIGRLKLLYKWPAYKHSGLASHLLACKLLLLCYRQTTTHLRKWNTFSCSLSSFLHMNWLERRGPEAAQRSANEDGHYTAYYKRF